MERLGRSILIMILLAAVLLSSGCAIVRKAQRVSELEAEIIQLRHALQNKDGQINELQKLLDAQQKRLREQELANKKSLERLEKELKELKAKPRIEQEGQFNLK